jgi:hypothetical protein
MVFKTSKETTIKRHCRENIIFSLKMDVETFSFTAETNINLTVRQKSGSANKKKKAHKKAETT